MSTLQRLKQRIARNEHNDQGSFDVKQNRKKQEVGGRVVRGAQGRPGASKSRGETLRQEELLPQWHSRNRAGGLVDRRFGERANISAEEKMLERFTKERERRARKEDRFRLDDGSDEEGGELLTHYGRALDLEDEAAAAVPEANSNHDAPKSKKDVMSELIAKSKLHKYLRQKQVEEDDVERAALNEELDGIRSLLGGNAPQPTEAQAVESEESRGDRQYDELVREMAYDIRSRPSERTKTDEEIAAEEAEKLHEQERQRLQRMRGEDVDESDHDAEDDAGRFGLQRVIQEEDPEFDESLSGDDDVEDEISEVSSNSASSDADESVGLETESSVEPAESKKAHTASKKETSFTYPCPESLTAFLSILDGVEPSDYPLVVHRILVLHNQKLHPENKAKLASFACVLFEALVTLADRAVSFDVLEALLPHLHDLAPLSPHEIASTARAMLKDTAQKTIDELARADLFLLTLIPIVFPSSDHYHVVITPAMLFMGSVLAQPLDSLSHVVKGLFICTLAHHYQRLSQRYIPEVALFLDRALAFLAGSSPGKSDRLSFGDCFDGEDSPARRGTSITMCLVLIDKFADLWTGKSAFIEMFSPMQTKLREANHPGYSAVLDKLDRLLKFARQARRPLELQHHRPLPIPTYAPKFEDKYSLDRKSYDPDRERNQAAKLRAEYKMERKGAIRELRKDAAFLTRQQQQEKKEKDAAYHAKMAKLVGTVQTEEGREKNEYERIKRRRTGK